MLKVQSEGCLPSKGSSSCTFNTGHPVQHSTTYLCKVLEHSLQLSMVIMENYYAQEKCRDLWIKIDHLHLGYLELEESPEKIKQREKLEGKSTYI